MLCGERVYTRPTPTTEPRKDPSGAPRQALHSAELEFTHPATGQAMRFNSPLPRDLGQWLKGLKEKTQPRSRGGAETDAEKRRVRNVSARGDAGGAEVQILRVGQTIFERRKSRARAECHPEHSEGSPEIARKSREILRSTSG